MNDLLTLKNIDLLKIEGTELIGCNQEWYSKPWQRLSGCGPTAASMIALYQIDPKKSAKTLDEAKATMNRVWQYVTPGFGGINRLDRFYNGFSKYLGSMNLTHQHHAFEIPKEVTHRPHLSQVVDFIVAGLSVDAPIAFLNLNNGKVHNLEAYHWVLITGLDLSHPSIVLAHILDGGVPLIIDLSLWLETTTSSGGFVYFTL
ncbi:MAG: hypothetical protein HGB31_03380 [Erysipelotrichaceae bacterium]|nr:hypothetical protein [Erysipelotrichaceae bacterium]